MNTKYYPKKVSDADIEIELHIDEARLLNETLELIMAQREIVSDMDSLPCSCCGAVSEHDETMHVLQEEVLEDLFDLADRECAFLEALSAMEDVRERAILFYRYLRDVPWMVIADKLGVSVRTIIDWHANALRHMSFPPEDEET